MISNKRIRHIGQEWLIVYTTGKWYAQSERHMIAGGFDTAKQAEAWIKALRSPGTADPLESYPATHRTPNQPVEPSQTPSWAIPGQVGDVYTHPECVTPPVTPPVPNPLYYVPCHDGTFRSMTYKEILSDLGPEKTAALFRPAVSDPLFKTDPIEPPRLSRIGAFFRLFGLRT